MAGVAKRVNVLLLIFYDGKHRLAITITRIAG